MALTSNFYWPVATPGTTTPPAANSTPPSNPVPPASVKFNEVVDQITGDGVATNIVITHNLGITAGELAQQWPEVRFEPTVAVYPAGFYVFNKTINTVSVGFSGTGVGVYGLIRIKRPSAPSR